MDKEWAVHKRRVGTISIYLLKSLEYQIGDLNKNFNQWQVSRSHGG